MAAACLTRQRAERRIVVDQRAANEMQMAQEPLHVVPALPVMVNAGKRFLSDPGGRTHRRERTLLLRRAGVLEKTPHEAGGAGTHRLASREDPHAVGEPVDGPTPDDVVGVAECLGDQVGGPGDRQGDEDQSAQVHDPTLDSLAQTSGDVNRCVVKCLL